MGFQSVRSNTASFRSTATTAQFLALGCSLSGETQPVLAQVTVGPEGPRIYAWRFLTQARGGTASYFSFIVNRCLPQAHGFLFAAKVQGKMHEGRNGGGSRARRS
jgi:hypothetical protein